MPRFAFYCFLLQAGAALAQAPAKFEVASIKPSDPNARGSSIMTDHIGGLKATNTPIRALITMAYGLRDFQLSGGPGWLSSDRYDVMAKPERMEGASDPTDEARDARWKERVRSLLAERFGLVIHKETKEEQIYWLTIAKGGSKLTEVTAPGDRQGVNMNRGRLQGFVVTTQRLADSLAGAVGRPVVDKTGLTRKYDWKLEWSPDPEDTAGPTIFTAVQEQLGLKLETARGPVDTYVIDHIDRPSEN